MVGRSVSASSPPSVAEMVNALQAGQSSGELAVERRVDLHRFRALFPYRWADFLRSHFRNSADIAAFFDVDDKTARNWLEGTTKPSAPTAIIAVARIPGAMAELMRAA